MKLKSKILDWVLNVEENLPTPEPMTETAPLDIKITDYNDVPVFKAKPGEIKAWAHCLQWQKFWRWLINFNWEVYGDVQDFQFLYAVGYDQLKHRAIFAFDTETYYAIDFDEEDQTPTNNHNANCVLIRLRLIAQEFYRLNRRPLRVEVVKPV